MLFILWIMIGSSCWSGREYSWGRLTASNDVCGHGRVLCKRRPVAMARRMHLQQTQTMAVNSCDACCPGGLGRELPVPGGVTPESTKPHC